MPHSKLGALFAIIFFLFSSPIANAACFDPAIEAGYAYKDQIQEWLVVVQSSPSNAKASFGDLIAGVGVKGQYFGCKVSQAVIQSKIRNTKKFSLYLPFKNSHVQGFEVDISAATRRVVVARAIMVPWDVVDRTGGVTAACVPSAPATFENFLYGALRNAKSRRCTQLEIDAVVGHARPLKKKSANYK